MILKVFRMSFKFNTQGRHFKKSVSLMAIALNEHKTLKVWFKDAQKVDLLKKKSNNHSH